MEELMLCPSDFLEGEVIEVLLLLADKLGLEVWRTNATKHGDHRMELRSAHP